MKEWAPAGEKVFQAKTIGLIYTTAMFRFRRIGEYYKRLFSVSEIETTPVLQWMCGVTLLFFYATFTRWIYSDEATIDAVNRGAAYCWPYFQSCHALFFLHSLPYSYVQMTFYMGLLVSMCATVYAMWKKRWALVHALLSILFAWKLWVMFVLSYEISGNYDYYHVFLTFLLLVVPHKEYFLKLCFVVLYFLSVTTKFHQTWILGSYFTSLHTGTPLFPDAVAPLLTNTVIFMQVIGSWFLISRNWPLQRLSLTYFTIFHLYSGILVRYLYPSIALTALLVLFGPLYRYTPPPRSLLKALPGALLILTQFAFQMPAHFIVGDQKLTLEGNKYGMYMFEANHQCIGHMKYIERRDGPVAETFSQIPPGTQCPGGSCVTKRHTYADGAYTVREETWESAVAWNRCDPYLFWQRTRRFCELPRAVRVDMQFDHSIDGGPFYRIIDERDICGLTYHPFVHNNWILLPPDAKIVGYPVQNILR